VNPQTDRSTPYPAGPQPAAPVPMPEPRPMYWSVRRELWENRSIYIAPLVVAAVVLFATSLSMIGLPRRMRAFPTLDPAKGHASIASHFSMAPAPIMLAAFIVGFFYCLDALYGERRDRSILFWKSLPVSDRTTVLSKAGIPFVVLPLIAYALSVAAQIFLLLLGTMALLGSGQNPAAWWSEIRFFQGLLIMFYGLTVHALWFAPIYGWLLLISAWARRTPILWAVLPLLAVAAVERIVLGTSSFMRMLGYRVTGAMVEAFAFQPKGGGDINRLSQLDPAKFLSAPGLWVGLAFAAVSLAAAVRLRRNREPI
jgi:ABC-2 type transport system permease protein